MRRCCAQPPATPHHPACDPKAVVASAIVCAFGLLLHQPNNKITGARNSQLARVVCARRSLQAKGLERKVVIVILPQENNSICPGPDCDHPLHVGARR